jgi:hypothetical protein
LPSKPTVVLALALICAAAFAAARLPVLESLVPDPPKKQIIPGLEIKGNGYHVRGEFADVEVEPLLLSAVGGWYAARGIQNPFGDFPAPMNYILLRVRLENLSKEDTLEFLPTQCTFDSCLAKEETAVYETFYSLPGGEKRLEVLGKTLYLKPLMLPPGEFIERLVWFEYDEPFAVKRMTLSLAGVSSGRTRMDLQFSYRAHYAKKQRGKH